MTRDGCHQRESYLAGDWQVWHFWAVIGSTDEGIHKQGLQGVIHKFSSGNERKSVSR